MRSAHQRLMVRLMYNPSMNGTQRFMSLASCPKAATSLPLRSIMMTSVVMWYATPDALLRMTHTTRVLASDMSMVSTVPIVPTVPIPPNWISFCRS